MRLGYSFWGFLGDMKLDKNGNPFSSPDGNASYSWSIIWGAQQRGWDVFSMQQDRDVPGYMIYDFRNFSAFCQKERLEAWLQTGDTFGQDLPDLDVLLVEWRWPIAGRNCGVSKTDPMYQPDLDRQTQLLEHYSQMGTRIILWDLDHKLSVEDELAWPDATIFETSVAPRRLTRERVRVEPPILVDRLLDLPTLPHDPARKLVYVGNRYERDDVIDEFIVPVSNKFPSQVEFWGNWTKEPTASECRRMWPNISYNGRVTTKEFRRVLSDAVACPLLAKRSYLETGFITPRPWEALMFGTIPIGLSSHLGIDDYVLFKVKDARELGELVLDLSRSDLSRRDMLRRKNVDLIAHMDVRNFLNKIEKS
jgi:hypothetical protein